jgi:2-hydroxycyclohexanecarboxyl-CoA dehydrogenase
MQRLEGKTVIVTGGGGGIGGATSRRFAQEGAKVAVFDLNEEAAQRVAEAIRAEGGAAQAFRRAIPLGRLGQPEDLASAIAFFGSDEASFITGQVLSVSGGLTMHG